MELFMAANKSPVMVQVEKIALPIAAQLGLELWDIEFVKEGASWFLRIFIDKEGGISLDDCEAFSHAVDGPLDTADPIEQQYYLEVSSPGIERELRLDRHFKSQLGQMVRIRLIRPSDDGSKELTGKLLSFDGLVITIDNGQGLISVKRSDTAFVRLYNTGEFV
jgi:ribosome maturation factor RimP